MLRLAAGPRQAGRRGAGTGPVREAPAWAADLFPAARPSGLPRGALGLGYLAGFVVLSATALARQSGVPATRTIWAEDGVIFYTQAVAHPFLHTVVTAYNGYDQLVPRLLVQLALLAPTRDASLVMALTGAMSLALIGCLVFHMARGHISSPLLRALLVCAMVLLPVAVVEMLDNLVNIPWWLFFAAFWAMLWRPAGRSGRWVAAAVCALAAASEPLVGLLLPLALARLAAWSGAGVGGRRDRRLAQSPVVGLFAGLAYQAGVVLAANGEGSFPHAVWNGILPNLPVRVGLGWVTGLSGTDALARSSKGLAEGLGTLVLVAVVAAGLLLGSRRVRIFTVTAAASAVLFFAVPVWLRGVGPLLGEAPSVGFAGRYAAVPMLVVISTVLVLAGELAGLTGYRRPGGRYARARHARARHADGSGRPGKAGTLTAAGACLVLLAPAWAADFRDANARSNGPSWPSQVSAATAQCRLRSSRGQAWLEIDPPGAGVVLPCSRLTGGR
jgi:hypothetical protein